MDDISEETFEEINRLISLRKITVCENAGLVETCDMLFAYVPQKRFCDECRRARERKYLEEKRKDPQWVEKINARKRKYYEENREKELARDRKYREENREKERARHRKYYEENREEINARKRARRRANKEK